MLMPIGVFYTNVPDKDMPENFEVDLSKILAEILSKPLERILINVIPGQRMAYGGTSEPACWLNLWSIGVFDKERNPNYATKLYPFITESLGIKSEKIVLLFHPIEAYQKAMPS
ncbi:D-dopachrome decarboxylase-A-like isoform X1 [Argiope bruennichi]|uniref:D-dopachrome decarboxylase-A-like isoform X1 n=2 Tax=Argiope bruennichi TaxID=94029 RepID=UPI002493D9A4|nr:D-dopachrome decarboxylase-A-like isoform X1 [Argiope bruennichi]